MTYKPILLDLFCKAGGAAMGYHLAGFEVMGVDIEPQPNYHFEFHRGDALEYLDKYGWRFDAIHASPPCQRYSAATKRWGRENEHPGLIEPTRTLLLGLGAPYVIENVVGAPLKAPVTLCGSMFDLGAVVGDEKRQLRRHRLFETSFPLEQPSCAHEGRTIGVYGNPGGSSKRDGITFGGVEQWREAMGIDWMTHKELAQAIPPAYTEFIGKQLLAAL